MQNLFNAIVLEVGRQIEGPRADSEQARREFWCNQVVELRANSNFTTDAEYRLVSAAHVIEAVKIKVDAHFRANHAGTGFILHYQSGVTPYHCKTSYVRKGDAERAAAKLNARSHGSENPYVVSSAYAYVAKTRAKLVRSAMNGALVMETTGTNWSSSVASESYWSN